ncbi:ketosteroid isomerase-like protein [Sphingomonas sp. BE270]|jgi:ketosteroid isomerase-like protein|uniref:nuclear transport factor 2 family protein n=1 Tax=unclassified Sphingomonas TaxID=196159 RepID=UPI00053D6DED|nr:MULTISPECIES: nuclear transport factor 2 family protein [unclassified Sphingomonas]MDR7258527.1 ketosteroid isomerase-like protein [Sphingomonas sp. BE270]
MSINRDTVASFYAALAAGDAGAALGTMAEDINWVGMDGWPYRATGRGPEAVAEGILAPMMADWEHLTVTPASILDAGDVVVATGRYGGVHRSTGKTLDVAFAHLWEVNDGKLAGFRQFTDTLLVDRAMR